jgi:hypothetical protein
MEVALDDLLTYCQSVVARHDERALSFRRRLVWVL